MKAWQKGYELDTLIDWTNKFESYNKHCHSPFMQAKKNGMATALEKGLLYEEGHVVYEMRTAKTTSKIKMFGAGPEIAEVHKGEKVISKIASTFDPEDTTPIRTMTDTLRKIEEPVWAHVFEEDLVVKTAIKDAGFKKIGTKVSTFSDIVGVYYKGGRKFIPVPETENINIDTYSQKNLFYSYRRSCHNNEKNYGRCISVILMT